LVDVVVGREVGVYEAFKEGISMGHVKNDCALCRSSLPLDDRDKAYYELAKHCGN
jgi:hypothetical protein